MNNFKLMTSIDATYEHQDGQTFRCSENFPNWNTPKTGTLKFVVNVPEGYPQPSFAIDHDKAGSDTRWYTNIYNGAQIDINSGEGGPGGHALYIGTTSKIPKGFDGAATYRVDVYVSEGKFIPTPSGYKRMTSLVATYGPQDGQTFRCSGNFPNWDTPKTGTLKFVVNVPVGYPQPYFAIDHDKSGTDTRWYSHLSNEVEIDINSGEGGPGGHALYIGTTSKLPEGGLVKSQEYIVTVFVYEGNCLPPLDISISKAKKLKLIHKYAPYIYMDKKEEYFPSTVEYSFAHLERYLNSDGNYWLKTKKELKDPSSILRYFKGDLPNAKVYAFWINKMDVNAVEVTYFIYYPYNRGKQVADTIWGNHVGDWEHITIRFFPKFINGKWTLSTPKELYLSAHSGGNKKNWDDLKLVNSSPIIFSARGSHAMYFNAGSHTYKTIIPLIEELTDYCSEGSIFNTSQDGKIVAFDYSSKKGLNDEPWPTWMNDDFKTAGHNQSDPSSGGIFRWGNSERGCEVGFGSCRLENGPTGPISKKDVWDPNVLE